MGITARQADTQTPYLKPGITAQINRARWNFLMFAGRKSPLYRSVRIIITGILMRVLARLIGMVGEQNLYRTDLNGTINSSATGNNWVINR